MNILFALELSNNKWYLHVSQSDDINTVYMECKLISNFVRNNLPVVSYEFIQIYNDYDLDNYIKKYMRNYGINNVRGGIYTDIILNETDNMLINNNLKDKLTPINEKITMINTIATKYEKIEEWNENEIEKEINLINSNINYYRNSIKCRNNIKTARNGVIFSYDIKKRLSWLQNMITMNAKQLLNYGPENKQPLCTVYELKEYRYLMLELENVYYLYNKYFSDEICGNIEYIPKINLYRPDVLLDNFFCHKGRIPAIQQSYDEAMELLNPIEQMVYTIICRLQEYEFDIKNCGDMYEEECEYKLKYINEKSQLYKNV